MTEQEINKIWELARSVNHSFQVNLSFERDGSDEKQINISADMAEELRKDLLSGDSKEEVYGRWYNRIPTSRALPSSGVVFFSLHEYYHINPSAGIYENVNYCLCTGYTREIPGRLVDVGPWMFSTSPSRFRNLLTQYEREYGRDKLIDLLNRLASQNILLREGSRKGAEKLIEKVKCEHQLTVTDATNDDSWACVIDSSLFKLKEIEADFANGDLGADGMVQKWWDLLGGSDEPTDVESIEIIKVYDVTLKDGDLIQMFFSFNGEYYEWVDMDTSGCGEDSDGEIFQDEIDRMSDMARIQMLDSFLEGENILLREGSRKGAEKLIACAERSHQLFMESEEYGKECWEVGNDLIGDVEADFNNLDIDGDTFVLKWRGQLGGDGVRLNTDTVKLFRKYNVTFQDGGSCWITFVRKLNRPEYGGPITDAVYGGGDVAKFERHIQSMSDSEIINMLDDFLEGENILLREGSLKGADKLIDRVTRKHYLDLEGGFGADSYDIEIGSGSYLEVVADYLNDNVTVGDLIGKWWGPLTDKPKPETLHLVGSIGVQKVLDIRVKDGGLVRVTLELNKVSQCYELLRVDEMVQSLDSNSLLDEMEEVPNSEWLFLLVPKIEGENILLREGMNKRAQLDSSHIMDVKRNNRIEVMVGDGEDRGDYTECSDDEFKELLADVSNNSITNEDFLRKWCPSVPGEEAYDLNMAIYSEYCITFADGGEIEFSLRYMGLQDTNLWRLHNPEVHVASDQSSAFMDYLTRPDMGAVTYSRMIPNEDVEQLNNLCGGTNILLREGTLKKADSVASMKRMDELTRSVTCERTFEVLALNADNPSREGSLDKKAMNTLQDMEGVVAWVSHKNILYLLPLNGDFGIEVEIPDSLIPDILIDFSNGNLSQQGIARTWWPDLSGGEQVPENEGCRLISQYAVEMSDGGACTVEYVSAPGLDGHSVHRITKESNDANVFYDLIFNYKDREVYEWLIDRVSGKNILLREGALGKEARVRLEDMSDQVEEITHENIFYVVRCATSENTDFEIPDDILAEVCHDYMSLRSAQEVIDKWWGKISTQPKPEDYEGVRIVSQYYVGMNDGGIGRLEFILDTVHGWSWLFHEEYQPSSAIRNLERLLSGVTASKAIDWLNTRMEGVNILLREGTVKTALEEYPLNRVNDKVTCVKSQLALVFHMYTYNERAEEIVVIPREYEKGVITDYVDQAIDISGMVEKWCPKLFEDGHRMRDGSALELCTGIDLLRQYIVATDDGGEMGFDYKCNTDPQDFIYYERGIMTETPHAKLVFDEIADDEDRLGWLNMWANGINILEREGSVKTAESDVEWDKISDMIEKVDYQLWIDYTGDSVYFDPLEVPRELEQEIIKEYHDLEGVGVEIGTIHAVQAFFDKWFPRLGVEEDIPTYNPNRDSWGFTTEYIVAVKGGGTVTVSAYGEPAEVTEDIREIDGYGEGQPYFEFYDAIGYAWEVDPERLRELLWNRYQGGQNILLREGRGSLFRGIDFSVVSGVDIHVYIEWEDQYDGRKRGHVELQGDDLRDASNIYRSWGEAPEYFKEHYLPKFIPEGMDIYPLYPKVTVEGTITTADGGKLRFDNSYLWQLGEPTPQSKKLCRKIYSRREAHCTADFVAWAVEFQEGSTNILLREGSQREVVPFYYPNVQVLLENFPQYEGRLQTVNPDEVREWISEVEGRAETKFNESISPEDYLSKDDSWAYNVLGNALGVCPIDYDDREEVFDYLKQFLINPLTTIDELFPRSDVVPPFERYLDEGKMRYAYEYLWDAGYERALSIDFCAQDYLDEAEGQMLICALFLVGDAEALAPASIWDKFFIKFSPKTTLEREGVRVEGMMRKASIEFTPIDLGGIVNAYDFMSVHPEYDPRKGGEVVDSGPIDRRRTVAKLVTILGTNGKHAVLLMDDGSRYLVGKKPFQLLHGAWEANLSGKGVTEKMEKLRDNLNEEQGEAEIDFVGEVDQHRADDLFKTWEELTPNEQVMVAKKIPTTKTKTPIKLYYNDHVKEFAIFRKPVKKKADAVDAPKGQWQDSSLLSHEYGITLGPSMASIGCYYPDESEKSLRLLYIISRRHVSTCYLQGKDDGYVEELVDTLARYLMRQVADEGITIEDLMREYANHTRDFNETVERVQNSIGNILLREGSLEKKSEYDFNHGQWPMAGMIGGVGEFAREDGQGLGHHYKLDLDGYTRVGCFDGGVDNKDHQWKVYFLGRAVVIITDFNYSWEYAEGAVNAIGRHLVEQTKTDGVTFETITNGFEWDRRKFREMVQSVGSSVLPPLLREGSAVGTREDASKLSLGGDYWWRGITEDEAKYIIENNKFKYHSDVPIYCDPEVMEFLGMTDEEGEEIERYIGKRKVVNVTKDLENARGYGPYVVAVPRDAVEEYDQYGFVLFETPVSKVFDSGDALAVREAKLNVGELVWGSHDNGDEYCEMQLLPDNSRGTGGVSLVAQRNWMKEWNLFLNQRDGRIISLQMPGDPSSEMIENLVRGVARRLIPLGIDMFGGSNFIHALEETQGDIPTILREGKKKSLIDDVKQVEHTWSLTPSDGDSWEIPKPILNEVKGDYENMSTKKFLEKWWEVITELPWRPEDYEGLFNEGGNVDDYNGFGIDIDHSYWIQMKDGGELFIDYYGFYEGGEPQMNVSTPQADALFRMLKYGGDGNDESEEIMDQLEQMVEPLNILLREGKKID